jgi:hypothetical protein
LTDGTNDFRYPSIAKAEDEVGISWFKYEEGTAVMARYGFDGSLIQAGIEISTDVDVVNGTIPLASMGSEYAMVWAVTNMYFAKIGCLE